ncbi:hypothetical protein SBV1_770056 [Verrucomicrobia bacterium]|nr:hypothetical protein SBV1_770056 [Verrucomicrobiota bacterium]
MEFASELCSGLGGCGLGVLGVPLRVHRGLQEQLLGRPHLHLSIGTLREKDRSVLIALECDHATLALERRRGVGIRSGWLKDAGAVQPRWIEGRRVGSNLFPARRTELAVGAQRRVQRLESARRIIHHVECGPMSTGLLGKPVKNQGQRFVSHVKGDPGFKSLFCTDFRPRLPLDRAQDFSQRGVTHIQCYELMLCTPGSPGGPQPADN